MMFHRISSSKILCPLCTFVGTFEFTSLTFKKNNITGPQNRDTSLQLRLPSGKEDPLVLANDVLPLGTNRPAIF